MKRPLTFVLLLLLSFSLYSAWKPEIGISGSMTLSSFDKILDKSNNVHPSFKGTIELSLTAFSFKNGDALNIPLGFSFHSCSFLPQRTFLQSRLSFFILAEYSFRITSLLSLSTFLGCGYMKYPQINAGNIYLKYGASVIFLLNNFFALNLPLAFTSSPGEFSFSAGAGITFYLVTGE